LRSSGLGEGIDEDLPGGVVEAVKGGHPATGHTPDRRHTGSSGHAVDQYRAASALALGAATVLNRTATQIVSESVEQRPVLSHLYLDTVDFQLHGHRATLSARHETTRAPSQTHLPAGSFRPTAS
jgi:hypothetical protein